MLALPLSSACESAQEKCDKARAAAAAAWGGYVETLERAHATAKQTQLTAQQKLGHELDQRLSPAAQRLADSRYNRSDEAWFRAHQAAMNEACKKDTECSTLKRNNAEAGVTLADLDERLPLARAARDALQGDAALAKTAASAVIVHPEYPQLKQAQQLTRELAERCEGVPAADPNAAEP